MVVPGEPEPAPPVPRRVRSAAEDRLTDAVSDITRLATAMSALSLRLHPEEAPSRQQDRALSGDGHYGTPGGHHELVQSGSTPHTTHGLGATGALTTGIGGYANVPDASTETHRQGASRYRA